MPETWADVLDDIERRTAGGEAAGWEPPTGLGPIPAELAPRARALMAQLSQQITTVKGKIAAAETRKRIVRAVPAEVTADVPRYLDEAF